MFPWGERGISAVLSGWGFASERRRRGFRVVLSLQVRGQVLMMGLS
jgi:hypothetical protein